MRKRRTPVRKINGITTYHYCARYVASLNGAAPRHIVHDELRRHGVMSPSASVRNALSEGFLDTVVEDGMQYLTLTEKGRNWLKYTGVAFEKPTEQVQTVEQVQSAQPVKQIEFFQSNTKNKVLIAIEVQHSGTLVFSVEDAKQIYEELKVIFK